MRAKGFTLIEIIVVLAGLIIMSLILSQIFSRTLKGGGKATILAAMKQNGQSALETMDKNIRNATKVICLTSDSNADTPDTLVVQNGNGTYTRYQFMSVPSSNGKLQQDNPTYSTTLCVDTFTGQPMTDTDPKSGVSIEPLSGSPVFTVDHLAGYGDIVTIKFQVNLAVDLVAVYSSQISPVPFQTTIELRSQ